MLWFVNRRKRQTAAAVAAINAAGYIAVLRPQPIDDMLVVNLSWDIQPRLQRFDFGGPTLDIADTQLCYYLAGFDQLLDGIHAIARANAVSRLCLFGSSKGGFAALALSRRLAERMPGCAVSALSFSPQTRLWPRQRKLTFPSYRNMLIRAESDPQLDAALRSEGDQWAEASLPNLRQRVIYGSGQARDVLHATGLNGSSVRLDPLPLSFHASIIATLCASAGTDKTVSLIAALFRDAAIDPDMAEDALNEEEKVVLAEIRALPPQPTIVDLIREITAP